jgi:DNA-binding transcriptional ArsR family regulator
VYLTIRLNTNVPTTGTPDNLSATFAALADPTRRAILARLIAGEVSVTELAEPFAMSLPAVSKHLKVLKRAGAVAALPTGGGPPQKRRRLGGALQAILGGKL